MASWCPLRHRLAEPAPQIARGVSAPLVIGGLGGSGTRAVAGVVEAIGYFIGRSVGSALDSNPLARWGKFWGPRYVAGRPPGLLMTAHLEVALVSHLGGVRPPSERWGWKHPQSHLLLPFLAERFPQMRFVHVLRDGRDMAFSSNRGQLGLYGEVALGRPPRETPEDAIRYWAWANTRSAGHAEQLGDRYLVVRLEDLCDDPLTQIRRLCAFTGLPGDGPHVERARASVRRPPTIERWRSAPADLVSRLDGLAAPALRRFGYLAADG